MPIKKMFTIIVMIMLSFGLLVAVVGCGPEPKPSATESPLPSPPSPVVTPALAESPLQTPEIPGPAFAIDRPLEGSGNRITGQGPAGVPIVVVDVTLTGQKLGEGFIDEKGHFDIKLSKPLEPGHRIGLMAGATQSMSQDEVQNYLQQLRRWKGKGARNLPFIGMLFDTALVEQ